MNIVTKSNDLEVSTILSNIDIVESRDEHGHMQQNMKIVPLIGYKVIVAHHFDSLEIRLVEDTKDNE